MALAVFEANVGLFPDDPNCYDSMAEAFPAGGNREQAIDLDRRALEVDPGFEDSRRMLDGLTVRD
jgi:hypothetical protein